MVNADILTDNRAAAPIAGPIFALLPYNQAKLR
jgi:hypothetical protein